MERIYHIKLSRVDYLDIWKIFDVQRYSPFVPGKFNVRLEIPLDAPSNQEIYESADIEVYDPNLVKLGRIKLNNYSNFTVITFDILDSKHRQEFIEYIWSQIKKIHMEGFIILDIQGYGEETIRQEVDVKSYDDRFRLVFELWVYDQESDKYVYGWHSKGEFYSASIYIWFNFLYTM